MVSPWGFAVFIEALSDLTLALAAGTVFRNETKSFGL
jgi:hypothetical protein